MQSKAPLFQRNDARHLGYLSKQRRGGGAASDGNFRVGIFFDEVGEQRRGEYRVADARRGDEEKLHRKMVSNSLAVVSQLLERPWRRATMLADLNSSSSLIMRIA